jgi:hypothetical protein
MIQAALDRGFSCTIEFALASCRIETSAITVSRCCRIYCRNAASHSAAASRVHG